MPTPSASTKMLGREKGKKMCFDAKHPAETGQPSTETGLLVCLCFLFA